MGDRFRRSLRDEIWDDIDVLCCQVVGECGDGYSETGKRAVEFTAGAARKEGIVYVVERCSFLPVAFLLASVICLLFNYHLP